MSDGLSFAAIDLGAESGRVIVGTLHHGRIQVNPVHRFPNRPLHTPDGLHWNLPQLYTEILDGLRAAVTRCGDTITGVGVDSWAVDYGLLDDGGRLLGLPYTYRDARTDSMVSLAAERVPAQHQYARTGIAQLQINTIYQLLAQRVAREPALDAARSLLMIPDLLHYWLCGEQSTECTNASTTGLLDVGGHWAGDILAALDLPAGILLPPLPSGTVLGSLRGTVQRETGLRHARIILPATHDTASAVVAVPASPAGATHVYISSGTWSLLGLELDHPVVSEEARLAGFTNERGVQGTYRFLTNIMGLWLLQESRRSWQRQGQNYGYEDLTARAAAIESPGVILDVNDSTFFHPPDMPEAIARYLRVTGQRPLHDAAEFTRAILEGLALNYCSAIKEAERLAGVRTAVIHIVGGGARNGLLCQLTADGSGRPVVAGPVEATAMGNVLIQAMGEGRVASVAEARSLVRASAELTEYEPRPALEWDERLERLHTVRSRRREAGMV